MGKETVLALLLREKGHFVSGEAVSAELGITRAAIWKSISALRAQGYEIDAVTGRGYCLKSLPDTLTEQTVRSYLGYVETVGKRIDCFDSIDSTNAYLKRIALDGRAGRYRRRRGGADERPRPPRAAAFRARRARAFTCRLAASEAWRRRS